MKTKPSDTIGANAPPGASPARATALKRSVPYNLNRIPLVRRGPGRRSTPVVREASRGRRESGNTDVGCTGVENNISKKKTCKGQPWVFVQGVDGEPLGMVHPAIARQWRTKKKAVLQRIGLTTIRLYCPCTQECFLKHRKEYTVRIGIDPGAKTTGLAAAIDGRVVWSAEIAHRSDHIRELMRKRRCVRSSRRCRRKRKAGRAAKPARWQHRKRPEGWLPPSTKHRVDSVLQWIDRILPYVQVGAKESIIVVETAAFDTHKVLHPDVEGSDYQKGPLWKTNLRAFVKTRDKGRCVYCGAEKPETLDHVIPQSKGGPHAAWNRVTACAKCNEEKSDQHLETWLETAMSKAKRRTRVDTKRRAAICQRAPKTLAKIQALADSKISLHSMAATNIVAPIIAQRLAQKGHHVERVSGGDTTAWRRQQGLVKTHAHDAVCIAGQGDALHIVCEQPLYIRMIGRGQRLIIKKDKFGFPRRSKRTGNIVQGHRDKPPHGIRVGDIVCITDAGRRRRIGTILTSRYAGYCVVRTWRGQRIEITPKRLSKCYRSIGAHIQGTVRRAR